MHPKSFPPHMPALPLLNPKSRPQQVGATGPALGEPSKSLQRGRGQVHAQPLLPAHTPLNSPTLRWILAGVSVPTEASARAATP